MKNILMNIPAQWRVTVGIIFIAIIMTVIYDYSWQVDFPLTLRNLSGLILFTCIMFGAGVAYIAARIYGSSFSKAVKISITVPIIWYIKEIIVAMNFYGFAAGIYAGLQGPYLFYFGIMFMMIGIFNLCYQVTLKLIKKPSEKLLKPTGLLLLPMFVLGGIEGIGLAVFGVDVLVFQGFLAGYRTIIL